MILTAAVELSALVILTPLAGRVPVSNSAHSVLRMSLAELAVLSKDVALDCFRTARAESGQLGNTHKNRPGNGDAAKSRDSPIYEWMARCDV